MFKISKYIAAEQKKIEQHLQVALSQMPPGAKPVAEHIICANGKRLRPLLVILMSSLFNYKEQEVYDVAIALEILHAATLLHDDVIDHAQTRRKKPTSHTIFGTTKTILSGDAMVARCLSIVAKHENSKVITSVSRMVEHTSTGQILEIDNKAKLHDNLDTYYETIRGKTAHMLACACELGVMLAKQEDTTIKHAFDFGLNIGMAFQIADDALDFTSSQKTGKPEGGDLKEAKFTPPIFYYYNSLSSEAKKEFKAKFESESFDDAETIEISKQIRELKFDLKTKELADSYLSEAYNNLKAFAKDDKKVEAKLLHEVIDYIKNRES